LPRWRTMMHTVPVGAVIFVADRTTRSAYMLHPWPLCAHGMALSAFRVSK
jgi:hypothetical protein